VLDVAMAKPGLQRGVVASVGEGVAASVAQHVRERREGHSGALAANPLGHKNIQHTVRYTELAPDRFKNFWR
jgi:hypothetical protein